MFFRSQTIFIDDYEDGDTVPRSPNWSVDTSTGYNAQSSTTLSGSYSGELDTSSSVTEVTLLEDNSVKKERVAFRVRFSGTYSTSDDEFFVTLRGPTNVIVEIEFRGGSNPTVYINGSSNVGWNADQTFQYEIANIDYSNATFDVLVNGTNVGSFNFISSPVSLSRIQFKNDRSTNGDAVTAFIDQIKATKEPSTSN